MVRWFVDQGMTMKSARGWMSFIIFALISNTIPITTWALYEVIRSPSLFAAVRAEVLPAFHLSPPGSNKPPTLNTAKLLSLPLLNSIFIETLRLYLPQPLPPGGKPRYRYRRVSHPQGVFGASRDNVCASG
ncbi:hypothetical protein B0T14DRAFT_525835 [Immersiella caudata]|uniref:Uncharacterized protein n=1 Tax=Immersiella caudata TaxID=314043 RepID=A0AA39U831_9PEZI|nr:hypothetical protein B0T14DRAFT_525835 [Immersiella caudata]